MQEDALTRVRELVESRAAAAASASASAREKFLRLMSVQGGRSEKNLARGERGEVSWWSGREAGQRGCAAKDSLKMDPG